MLNQWSEVKAALQRYPIHEQDDHAVTFAWPESGPESAIFQVVFCEFLERMRIFIGCNVMPESRATAHEALRLNSEMVIGSLIAFEGMLSIKHVLTIGGCDEKELHTVIASMARTAERAVKRLSPRAMQSDSLSL
jgi:hypothetical protein